MADKKAAQGRKEELGKGEALDLLELELPNTGGKEALYPVEVGQAVRKLKLDELIEFAGKYLEEGSIGGEEEVFKDTEEMLEFVKRYPEVTDFPEKVAEMIKGGKSPLEAYREFENQLLKERLQAFEKNADNRERSIGSARGEADSDDEFDELMKIYNAVFR